MATPDVELAKAIVDDINSTSRSWSMYFQAERSYKPIWIGKEELGDLQCLINPWPEVESEALDRSSSQDFYSIDFGFAKRLDAKTMEEIDDLRYLVHSVRARYMVTDLTVANVGKFIPLRRTDEYVAFDPTSLSTQRVQGKTRYAGDFLSVFRIPYRFLEV